MRRGVFLAFIFVSVFSFDAFACKCASKSVQQRFAEADAVFTGQVSDLAEADEYYLLATVNPTKLYKGMARKAVTIKTGNVYKDPGYCGFAFETGQDLLVFATGNVYTGEYYTDLCLGTNVLDRAKEDIAQLEAASFPQQEDAPCSEGNKCIAVRAYVLPEDGEPGKAIAFCQPKSVKLREGEWLGGETADAQCVCDPLFLRCKQAAATPLFLEE